MKRFNVCCKVTGYYDVEVEAETREEAEELALEKVCDTDLNDISYPDAEVEDVEELK